MIATELATSLPLQSILSGLPWRKILVLEVPCDCRSSLLCMQATRGDEKCVRSFIGAARQLCEAPDYPSLLDVHDRTCCFATLADP